MGKGDVTHRLATRLCRSSLRWPTYGGLIDRLRQWTAKDSSHSDRVTVGHQPAARVGWVDLENEPWWFSFEIARSWFCLVYFCFAVAYGFVSGIALRDRKAIRTVQVAAFYAIYPLLFLKVARMAGATPPLMQWWFTCNGSLWAYLISFALQLSLHFFLMRDRKEAE